MKLKKDRLWLAKTVLSGTIYDITFWFDKQVRK